MKTRQSRGEIEGSLTGDNYIFRELGSAMLQENIQGAEDNPYADVIYPDGNLDVTKLKGENPITYRIQAAIPDSSSGMAGKFRIAKEGTTNGYSRDPYALQKSFADELKDNNFTIRTGSTQASSERFYLWSTNVAEENPETWDNSKDLGVVPVRDLQITKTAADDPNTKVEGAVFAIYAVEDSELPGEGFSIDGKTPVATITTDENGEATAELLWFQKYVIVEQQAASGYELDDAVGYGTHMQKIQVTGAGGETGTVKDYPGWLLNIPETSEITTEETLSVANIRRTTSAAFQVKKSLTGKELASGEFTFELVKDGQVVEEAQNDANGLVTFEEQILQRTGIHTFYIREKIPEGTVQNQKDGITYDRTEYQVTVNVTWDSEKQKLVAETPVYKVQNENGNWISVSGEAALNNTYQAEGVWKPEGTKTLIGRKLKAEDIFNFEVKDITGLKPDDIPDAPKVGTGKVEGKTAADGESVQIEFTEIPLEETGVFMYRISETGEGKDGLTYDTNYFDVQIRVTDDGKGTLIPKVTSCTDKGGKSASGVSFQNTYKTDPTGYSPVVLKTVTGDPRQAGVTKTFTFKLTEKPDSKDGAVINTGGDTLQLSFEPSTSSPQNGAFKASNGGKAITFTKDGEYEFQIQEVIPDGAVENKKDGYTYDNTLWTLRVKVSDDGLGKLKVDSATYEAGAVTDKNQAEFTNDYQVEETSLEIPVKKQILIEDGAIPADAAFNFHLESLDPDNDGFKLPDNPETVLTVRKGETESTGKFGAITFTKAGRYSFKITEKKPEAVLDGYEYSDLVYNVTIAVEDKRGKLEAKIFSIENGQQPVLSEIVFTNYYNAQDTHYTPKITKFMEEGSYKLPEDKQFSFTLKPYGDDNPDKGAWVNAGNPDEPEELKELEKTAAAVTIPKGTKEYAKEGYEASFPEITFTKSGTYKFQITEDGVDEKPPGNLNLKRKLPGICLRMQPSASALPLERRTRTAYSFLEILRQKQKWRKTQGFPESLLLMRSPLPRRELTSSRSLRKTQEEAAIPMTPVSGLLR